MGLLLKKKIGKTIRLAIWEIEESEDWYLSQLQLNTNEKNRLASIRGSRRLEWLAGRWLLHVLSGEEKRLAIVVDDFGKPFLKGKSDWISLSHSHQRVAAIISNQPVGIDIQFLVEKIKRIAGKFLRKEEAESLEENVEIEQLHVYWGAKESLYKAYGKKQLEFRDHIFVTPFAYKEQGTLKGKVIKEDFKADYSIFYEKVENYMLVFAKQQSINT